MSNTLTEQIEEVENKNATEHTLVLFNDKEHDFKYVTACLIEFCKHEPMQAEQCTLIAHHNGKCAVKHGSLILLKDIHEKMAKCKLTTEIN